MISFFFSNKKLSRSISGPVPLSCQVLVSKMLIGSEVKTRAIRWAMISLPPSNQSASSNRRGPAAHRSAMTSLLASSQ